ncbi:GNAT family N-acetyltransferase [Bradyrhizobium sp. Mp64]|uniref:GNAT family N-acetyltransferase n=1 Tax=Bradyrhizobium sp. Mp64 TaxID=3042158 RepID=UPI00248B41FD|nr:GNAT family N-acetyltransferase [Bradyrhizobium sp. Mp64]MDI2103940.1 GNAT family N-acetyltransferase [Bradyrhizobium sp. Mp64]
MARTYGAFSLNAPNKLIAYITLVCGQIELEDPELGEDVDYRYDHYPAVKIARLATDRRLRGQGIGEALVDFSLGLIRTQICPYVGCRFVVVDSKQTAVTFYSKKCGFTLLDTEENRNLDSPLLFLDLYKVEKAIDAADADKSASS